MPRKATQRETQADPSLPGVLIPPSSAQAHERDAYWLELIDNPEEFRKALATEDFFTMIGDLPDALWHGRLSLFFYRMPDDDGIMIKNAESKRKKMITLYQPIKEDEVGKRWGGGKYRVYLKLDNKDTLREETFEMDKSVWGPPKMSTGQVVELDGKTVSIAGQPQPPQNGNGTGTQTDVAKVIDAMAEANKSAMDIQQHATKTAIEMVREQSAPPNNNGHGEESILAKLLPALLERVLAPPPPAPDPLQTLKAAKELFAMTENPAPEPKDPPITEAMNLVKDLREQFPEFTGRRSNPAPAENSYAWLTPIAGVFEKLVMQAPQLMHEFRANKDLEFQRLLFLRTAQPGQPVPAHLLPQRQAPPAPPAQPAQAQPAQPAANATPDRAQTITMIVQSICGGFDRHRDTGADIAALVSVQFGELIEAHGLEKSLTDPAEMQKTLADFPQLAQMLLQRVQHGKWKEFEQDLFGYMVDRWGTEDSGQTGPQPVA